MGRFYQKRIEENPSSRRYLIAITQAGGGGAEVEVSQCIFDTLDDLQREYWKCERREARHTCHIEMMRENELPHSRYSKDPEQLLIEQLEIAEVYRALHCLPVIQQKRFLMRHLIGLPIKQIAKIEGCSERAVKYSLTLARNNLQEILSEWLP